MTDPTCDGKTGYVLDAPLKVGGTVLAAVCTRSAHARRISGMTVARGHKTPVAFLFLSRDRLHATTPQGDPISLDQLDRMHPGVVARFRNAARGFDPGQAT